LRKLGVNPLYFACILSRNIFTSPYLGLTVATTAPTDNLTKRLPIFYHENRKICNSQSKHHKSHGSWAPGLDVESRAVTLPNDINAPRGRYPSATAVRRRVRSRTNALVISAAMPGTNSNGKTSVHSRIPSGTVSKTGRRKGT
jgi:hypothetical protein